MNPVHLALGAAIVVLAIIGLCWTLARVADGLERAWDWLSWRFRGNVGDDYTEEAGLCAGCVGVEHCDGRELGCDCTCTWPEDWDGPLEELPPERSREELGFTGPQPASMLAAAFLPEAIASDARMGPAEREFWSDLYRPHRERWAPAWEAEARSAYQALDLDYPSGLLARVREAGQ